jgi:hypothetical protein
MMAEYFAYTGLGGIYTGTFLPTATGIITTSEKVIAYTPAPDNRVGPQGGVLVTADIFFGVSTCTTATFYCRQSTLGTAAITGNQLTIGGNVGTGTYWGSIGTQAGTISGAGEAGVPHFRFQWVDLTGSFPLPSYCLTALTAAGTATVNYASITAQPIGA